MLNYKTENPTIKSKYERFPLDTHWKYGQKALGINIKEAFCSHCLTIREMLKFKTDNPTIRSRHFLYRYTFTSSWLPGSWSTSPMITYVRKWSSFLLTYSQSNNASMGIDALSKDHTQRLKTTQRWLDITRDRLKWFNYRSIALTLLHLAFHSPYRLPYAVAGFIAYISPAHISFRVITQVIPTTGFCSFVLWPPISSSHWKVIKFWMSYDLSLTRALSNTCSGFHNLNSSKTFMHYGIESYGPQIPWLVSWYHVYNFTVRNLDLTICIKMTNCFLHWI